MYSVEGTSKTTLVHQVMCSLLMYSVEKSPTADYVSTPGVVLPLDVQQMLDLKYQHSNFRRKKIKDFRKQLIEVVPNSICIEKDQCSREEQYSSKCITNLIMNIVHVLYLQFNSTKD